MNIRFYLTRPENESETAIFARITYNYNSVKVYIGLSVLPSLWDKRTGRLNGRKKDRSIHRPAIAINTRLDNFKGIIEKCFYDYCNNQGSEPSPATLKKEIDIALGRGRRVKYNLFEYFEDFIERTKQGLRQTARGKLISPRTGLYYATTCNLLKDFNPRLDFKDIDLDFYGDWLTWLRGKGFAENNVGAHVKRLKAVLSEATERGYNKNTAFKSRKFAVIKEEVDNVALTEKELSALQALDLSASPHLDRVRDLFLIGCYTGLRFSDFSRLTAKNIKGNFIEITQAKTGAAVAIPIHPVVKTILSKHNGKLPKAISNQKTNAALKELCRQIPELREKVSITRTQGGVKRARTYAKWEITGTHTARRTFATNSYLQGIPTVSIMAVTGHKTEKAFLKYIKVTSKQHAKIVAGYWARENDKLKIVR